jgi:hypothetical protein
MPHETQDTATCPSQGEAVPGWRNGLATGSRNNQSGPKTTARHLALSQMARQHMVIALLAGLFLVLVAVLVWYLTLLPTRSPFIVAVAADYRWPLPPNGWAQEDVAGLRNHLGDQTLAVTDVSLAKVLGEEPLVGFARHLELVAERTAPSRAIVVYVSAHGVVDGAGRPCLLLPEHDPLDSSSWLPLSKLLEQFRAVAGHRKLLLILDCNRQLDNWCIGLSDNQFAERLETAVADANVAGLAVLNSASPGQRAWTSPNLRGSVFGHYLQLGLAGAADSDGDRSVSLHELVSYLQANVARWVGVHRAARQMPFLFPSNAPDFAVAWSLRPKDLRKLIAQSSTRAPALAPSPIAKLAELWQRHESLERYHPHHYAPLTWQRVEGELLWLEQAALAGPAYDPTFENTYRSLKERLDRAHERIDGNAVPPVRLAAILAEDETLLSKTLRPHSLPMAEYLGTATPAATTVDQAGRQPALQPQPVPGGNALLPSPGEMSFSTDQLKKLIDHYQVSLLWQNTQATEDVLDLHRLGERLAVPHSNATQAVVDSRSHLMVRPLLNQCDRDRRIVEDKIFLGPWAAADVPQQFQQISPQSVRDKYESVRHINGLLAESYQVRDRAWRNLPYLARWARGPGPTSGLLPLFGEVSRLDSRLRNQEQTPADLATAGQALQVASGLNAALNGFQDAVLNEAGGLSTAQATPEHLRRIVTLLSTPLVSDDLRTELFSRYVGMLQEIDSDRKRIRQAPSTAVPAADRHWAVASFAAMLQTPNDEPTPVDRNDLPAMGEKLRAALHETRLPALGDLTIDFDLPMRPSGPIEAGQDHATLHVLDVERRLRRFVSLQSSWQGNPYQLLQRRHVQHLLFWQSQRVLDDFWASVAPGAEPYFAVTVDTYLDEAEVLDHADDEARQKIVHLRESRDQRAAAARNGLVTTSTDLLLIDEDVEATAQVRVEVTPEGQSLPMGLATVCLRDQTAPNAATIRPLSIDQFRETLVHGIPISVRGRELAGDGKARQAAVLYRGHEFAGPLRIQGVAGAKTEIVRHHDEWGRITLRGPHFGQAAVVFILDCSHSMKDPVAVEVPALADQNNQPTKLHVAVAALRAMSERIGERNDTRVGVRLFGHRVGWRTDQVDVVARQQQYPRRIAPTLKPYEDVELLLPLGRFDSVTAGQVNHELGSLKPWGESPIYLAMMDAVKDFDGEDPQAERRIVVITDGINYQFNPPPESAYRRTDVEELCASRSIRVDIVGFAIPEDEQSEATREFTELARKTAGSFTTAIDPSSLMRTLEQLVERTTFRVTDDTGQEIEAETGETIHVQTKGSQRACRIEVVHLQADTALEGGESLQLVVSRDRRMIESLRYEDGSPVFAPLFTGVARTPTGYQAGFHRPTWTDGSVEFPVSFQRTDRGIPQRPGAVWVEIGPVRRDGTDSPDRYLFCDANYEPNLPCPLLRCRCLEWPEDADTANVRVWCLPHELAPAGILPVGSVANRTPPSGTGFELTGIPGVRVQVRTIDRTKSGGGFQVRVIQRHDLGVPANYLKAELSPAPDRIFHQLDWTRGVVLHTFDYAGHPPAGMAPALRFQTRSRFTENAWKLDQPIVLNVLKQNDVVLPPEIVSPQARQSTRSYPTSRTEVSPAFSRVAPLR